VDARNVISVALVVFELEFGLLEGEGVPVTFEGAGDPALLDLYLVVFSDDGYFAGGLLDFDAVGVALDHDVDLGV
jgi:hypothetical protein